MLERSCEVLVVGGGLGGCAAALALTARGVRTLLVEDSPWIGGQLTSQAVPPDEHPWIERFGCTRRYRSLRNAVREIYRTHYPLTDEARLDPELNPGDGWVSKLCAEPRVWLAALETMLLPARSQGLLEVLRGWRAIGAEVDRHRVNSVVLSRGGEEMRVRFSWVLDATETGELLPMTETEFRQGAESRAETGEPHAMEEPRPNVVQGMTWVFAMGLDPSGKSHVGAEPASYSRWRAYRPAVWPNELLSWRRPHPYGGIVESTLLPVEGDSWGFFHYRRIISARRWAVPVEEATLVNWPQNDYFEAHVLGPDADKALRESRELSECLLYWLQTEAPRPDGGTGWSSLRMRGDLVGTEDGLAIRPYIRESRRIVARHTVLESWVSAEANPGASRATPIEDSVGVGAYRIDLHHATEGVDTIDLSSLPFQIPLGSLVPVRSSNLLPACKNLGVTHITNGCFRLHPVEWNVGEAAGALAAFCLARSCRASDVFEKAKLVREFQTDLQTDGFELDWPTLRAL